MSVKRHKRSFVSGIPSPREVALDILGEMSFKGRPLDELFAVHPGMDRIRSTDRAWVRNLVLTTVRHLGELDTLSRRLVTRRLPRGAEQIWDILRIGACQLIYLNTPAHAAVDTSVKLSRDWGLEDYSGLVNAVLRRMVAEKESLLDGTDTLALNTPDWLWASWEKAYGRETCRAIAEAHLVQPPLDLTVKGDASAWAEKLEATVLPTGSLRRATGVAIPDLPGFDEGAWWVQDAAAALPAKLLGDVAGKTVADLCAAPGGKTAQLAAAGARVLSVEKNRGRMERLGLNLERLSLTTELIIADAAGWRPEAPVDAVLLDAPCTATGTIRRRPDVAWLKRPEDVAALAETQKAMLTAALDMVKPGGQIVYCVCSLQAEEGPDLVEGLLASGAPAEVVPISPDELGGIAAFITPAGYLRTLPCHWPDRGGLDGFFAARLRRR